MTEAEKEAGNKRLAKFEENIDFNKNCVHRYYCDDYHTDLNAIARVEQKIRDKYPDTSNSFGSVLFGGNNSYCASWYEEGEGSIWVYAETEAMARFEAALKLLNILEGKDVAVGFEKLADVSNGCWDNVDAAEYVDKLRGNK